MNDSEVVKNNIKVLDSQIKILLALDELTGENKPAWDAIKKSLQAERDIALDNYVADNSASNQAYAKWSIFICNLFDTFEDKTQLDNLMKAKESQIDNLQRLNRVKIEQGQTKHQGDAL